MGADDARQDGAGPKKLCSNGAFSNRIFTALSAFGTIHCSLPTTFAMSPGQFLPLNYVSNSLLFISFSPLLDEYHKTGAKVFHIDLLTFYKHRH